MKQYPMENIRNVALLSHCGAGKTSISEAVLYTVGINNRLGRVDDGTTTSDYDPDEVKRKISLNLALLPCEWQDKKINLIDTPGYTDLVGEVKAAVRVSEGAVITVCAASGVEVGTVQVWDFCNQSGLARVFFVNKMDRENADFNKTFEQIESRFGKQCVPIRIPVGAQKDFQGTIDLLTMKAYLGSPAKESEIPDSLKEEAESFREKLVEAIAETDDDLIEKYLGGEDISMEELTKALGKATRDGRIVPVLAGSAMQNSGIKPLLDTICSYLPSPAERDIATVDESGKEADTVSPSQDPPAAVLVFKTTADPYVGKLSYLRVFHGALESNSQVWNMTKGEMERIGQLFLLRGKNQEPIPQIGAGDIGAVAKLGTTGTGDTLGSKDSPMRIAPVEFPVPIFTEAVHPKSKADVDKLGTALTRLTEEDQTLKVSRNNDTKETILSGIGETQLSVAADRMLRKFGVSVELATPKVPYKETITVPVKAEHKHKKQTGGHGQYGHVLIEMEPLPRGSGREFVDKIVGGNIPKNYIPSVEKGVYEAMAEGELASYPVVDVRTTLYDGSFHPVDSSEICFKIAGAQALKKGLAKGQPIILEPIMNVKIRAPEESTGDIIGDLNGKRARVQGMNPEGDVNVVEAQAPLAEMLRYAIDLKSITQGRGSYTIEFSHYEEAPHQVTQKIISERQAETG